MIFEVILRCLYDGKNILNRWHYSSAGTPATVQHSFGLLTAFGGIPAPVTLEFPAGSVMRWIAESLSIGVQFRELSVEALYDVTDFYNVPYAPEQLGLVAGVAMSRFYAYALQSNRVRTDVRRGNKRFAGVVEEQVGVHGVLQAGVLATLGELADEMSAPLVYDDEGNTLTYTPAVLSFEKSPPDATHDEDWYAKYPTLAEQLDHTALGVLWSVKPSATTQNTRK